MKKFLLIIIFGLLSCSPGSAKEINFKCIGFKTYNTATQVRDTTFKDYMHLRINISKKLMIEMSDGGSSNTEWSLTDITDRYYYSDKADDYKENDFVNVAILNRYTGEFSSKHQEEDIRYFYHCEITKQLF